MKALLKANQIICIHADHSAIPGADLILDEISTHARAVFELNPDTDTIIEIGGHDFTD